MTKLNYLIFESDNKIARITLNRPEKRNALSPELIQELTYVFSEIENLSSVKVIILKSNGSVFSAGADLSYLKKLQGYSYAENLKDSNALKVLFEKIYTCSKIVISQIEGHAIAGGAGLVLVSDLIFSVPEAKIGFTEVKIGFVPALVSYFLIHKIGEARAKELLLTGNLIDARKAIEYGLFNEIVEKLKIDAYVENYANMLALNTSSESIKMTKQLFYRIPNMGLSEALNKLAEINANARSNEDCMKGIQAFLDKRKIQW